MKARIGIAFGLYWGGMAYVIDVIALIGALGAVGGLPALLDVLTRYARVAMSWSQGLKSRSGASAVSRHVQ
jgi:hypothetical protein